METNSATAIVLKTNSSERMRILSGGNVGIGTTNPGSKLHVNGTITVGATVSSFVYGTLAYVDATNGVTLSAPGQNMTLTTGYNEKLIIQSGQNGLQFQTNDGIGNYTDRFLINQTRSYFVGNVGIGTASPFSKLQVGTSTFSGGNGMFSDTRVGISNHGSLTGLMLASTYNDATFPEYGLVFVQGPSTANYNVWSLSPDGPAKGTNLNFIYGYNATNIHVGAPAMVLQGSSGNVGIGVTNPTKLLTVGGSTATSGINNNGIFVNINGGAAITAKSGTSGVEVQLNAETSQGTIGTYSNHPVDFRVNNSNVMWLSTSANVGIGTVSPATRLDISDGSSYFRIWGNSAGDFQAPALAPHIATGDFTIYSGAVGSGTFRLVVKNGGNVGIGVTNPAYALDVSGTIRATGDVIAFSDKRVKENISTLENSLEKVTQLRGVSYNKIGEEEKKIGVIAQEILEILPEVVQQDSEGMYSVAYGNITAVLIEAIKEQQNQINQLKDEVNRLKSK
jgi:hypothetical protein